MQPFLSPPSTLENRIPHATGSQAVIDFTHQYGFSGGVMVWLVEVGPPKRSLVIARGTVSQGFLCCYDNGQKQLHATCELAS